MKETVLDVIIYLIGNYTDENNINLIEQKESLITELEEAGFETREISRAFSWLENLQKNHGDDEAIYNEKSVRIYANSECERLPVEARGFLLFLEQSKVLDPASRELIIEQVLTLEQDISMEQFKWVVLMVLFNREHSDMELDWLEELIFDDEYGAVAH
jgi:Smg protein